VIKMGYKKTSPNLTKYAWVNVKGVLKRMAVKTPKFSSSAFKPRK